jgi:hypothetical protein
MVTISGPVTIDDRRVGNPRTSGVGNYPDKLKVIDDGDGRPVWFELAQHVNGTAPQKGTRTRLRLALGRAEVSAVKQGGETYTRYVDTVRIVGFVALDDDAAVSA